MRTDEQQVRALLNLAAEVPDEVSPPIARLITVGHHNRAHRIAIGAVTAAVAVIIGAAAPSVIAGLGTASGAGGGPAPATGTTAAQLAGYHWSKLAPSPLGHTDLSIVAWTGRELLEIGNQRGPHISTGSAAYDPATGRWRSIAPEPRLINPPSALTVWTGHQLLIIGNGRSCPIGAPGVCVPQVELYNPAANRWSTTRLPRSLGQDGKLLPLAATWTGSQVVVAGSDTTKGRLAVASYSPATGQWRVITPPLAAGHPLWTAGLVFARHRLLLWSSWIHQTLKAGVPHSRAGVNVFSRSENGAWSNDTAGWPRSKFVSGPVLTGRGVLVPPFPLDLVSHGYFVDPGTLTVTEISPGPLDHALPAFSWTGKAVIAVNARVAAGKIPLGATADYDPATRVWHSLRGAAALFPPKEFPGFIGAPAWTGHELLALTGDGGLLGFRR